MRSTFRVFRATAVFATLSLSACRLQPNAVDDTPLAAVKVINLLQGVDNASFGFETGRPLSVIAFPSIAPVDPASYFYVTAGVPRQLRVLLTTATVLDSAYTFTPNQYYTVVTLGTRGVLGVGAPSYLVLLNNMTPVITGNVRFRFVHGSASSGPVDVHFAQADSGVFDAGTRRITNVPYRGTSSIDAGIAGNTKVCIIATGVVPTASGSTCSLVRTFGVSAGVGLTAAFRDPATTESTTGLLLTVDRTP